MDEKEKRKLLALADKLVLMSNGLSSEQSDLGLAIASEFAPLAEYVISSLGDEKPDCYQARTASVELPLE